MNMTWISSWFWPDERYLRAVSRIAREFPIILRFCCQNNDTSRETNTRRYSSWILIATHFITANSLGEYLSCTIPTSYARWCWSNSADGVWYCFSYNCSREFWAQILWCWSGDRLRHSPRRTRGLGSSKWFPRENITRYRDGPQVASKTRAFCEGLWYTIHEWDTTQAKTWAQVPYIPLTCVTNENIPAANERMHREPFIQNMWILWNTRRELIQPETAFVPEELQIIKDPTTTEDEVRYICSRQNWFFPWELQEDIDLFSRAGFGNLYEHLMPDRVKLSDEVLPLKLVSPMGAERMWVFGYQRSFLSRF